MSPKTFSHQVAVGIAGISLAAPALVTSASSNHPNPINYQPRWTLMGGGCASAAEGERTEASPMPRGVGWIKDNAQNVTTASGIRAPSRGAVLFERP